jgi:phosphopantetheine adenylyltransferase
MLGFGNREKKYVKKISKFSDERILNSISTIKDEQEKAILIDEANKRGIYKQKSGFTEIANGIFNMIKDFANEQVNETEEKIRKYARNASNELLLRGVKQNTGRSREIFIEEAERRGIY